jgi:Ca2+-binding EF-hand superfamily protein
MRKVSSKAAMTAFKIYVTKTDGKPLCLEHFIEFMIGIMKKYDFCDSKAEEDNLKEGFGEVFKTFDYDCSGNLDKEEIANCLSMMCGGSINEKLLAAFNLFDINNSMTLDFD